MGGRRPSDDLPEAVRASGEISAMFDQVPAEHCPLFLELVQLLTLYVEDMPPELEAAVHGLSVYGVHPDWQVEQVRQILARWQPSSCCN